MSKPWRVKYMKDGRWAGKIILEEGFADGSTSILASICGGWLKTYKSALISEEQTKLLWKTWKKYGV